MSTEAHLPSVLQLVNPVAERAIVVGDPGRALELAQALLDAPLMCNHQRGLWGYTGTASDGRPLTVQSTGTGGPSVVPVVRELAQAGVERMVRAGSAVPRLPNEAADGALRVVAFAVVGDGAGRGLGHASGERLTPDAGMLAALTASGVATCGVLSVDVLPQDGGILPAVPDDVGAVDRQSAAFLAAAARHGVVAAAALAFPSPAQTEEQREAWWRAVGTLAASAVGAGERAPEAGATSPGS